MGTLQRIARRLALAAGLVLACGVASAQASGETPWPYAVKVDAQTSVLVYPPQLQSWDGGTLKALAAVVAREGTGEKMRQTYGTANLEARTLVDKGTRMVTLDQVRVTRAEFPTAGNAAKAWIDALVKDAASKHRVIALDRLEAALRTEEADRAADKLPLKNDPPTIVFSSVPAILVNIDGAPRYGAINGSALQRVINTRVLLLSDSTGRHYLHVFDGWLTANMLNGEWTVLPSESAELAKVRQQAEKTHAADLLSGVNNAANGQADAKEKPPTLKSGTLPRIVIATSPTELVVSDGAWSWTPIAGTQLSYVGNTTGNIFRDNADQRLYLLVSGRWFRATGEKGPWSFVAANALPADFAKIPEDSLKENVLASVAGTPQAREAAISATVAQTAAVSLSKTKLAEIRFDGDPRWMQIVGTQLSYAANTQTPLIRVDDKTYYALDNAVWFVGASASGPWRVATSVPAAIYAIPPSSPLHYVSYVRIYGVSGDTVYEGYTAGYQGSYIDPATGVVVYGTGYVYEPWVETIWVGAPPTYGYATSVTYTPWTGWAYGYCFGSYWGYATSAWGWCWGGYPYWGPWYYGWGYWWGGVAYGPAGGAIAWGPGGWAGYTGPIYQRWGNTASVSRYTGGYNAWTGNGWATHSGIAYNSRTGVVAAGQRGVVSNVYTGNYAAGGRGIATGPGGAVVGHAGGTAGNIYSGDSINAGKGFVYNPATGDVTKTGHISGDRGTIGHIGDDVYAGHDGNVYRNTGDGWQKHGPDGWQPVTPPGGGSGERPQQRPGEGGAGERNPQLQQQLDRDRQAREAGAQRTHQFERSSQGMQHQFGGARMGGFRGGGGRRR